MAQKSNIEFGSPAPSPMELAREAALQEKEQNLASSANPKQKQSEAGTISLDVSDIALNKEVRLTRTFTISQETEAQLNIAAQRLGTSKSAVLEKAFSTWWPAVKKMLDEKLK